MQNPNPSPAPAERPEHQRHDHTAAGRSASETSGRDRAPGENPGTLTDEDYLSAGGPESIDSAVGED